MPVDGRPLPAIQSILVPLPRVEEQIPLLRGEGGLTDGGGAIPTHLTIAGPWPLAVHLPLRELGRLSAAMTGVRFTLGTVGTLGDSLCLFPDGGLALLGWREKILEAVGSPDGVDAGWRLHVTLCRRRREKATRALEAAAAAALPLRCEIEGLLLAARDIDARITLRTL